MVVLKQNNMFCREKTLFLSDWQSFNYIKDHSFLQNSIYKFPNIEWILKEQGLGTGIDPGMALTPFPSSIVLDKVRTHVLSISSRVR